MRLAKFFHRARDNDGRKLLLITQSGCTEPQRPIVMGLTLGDHVTEFLRRDYGGLADAVAAFNAAADRLQGQGYVELAETDYDVSRLPVAPIAKPEWQRGLDRLVLALFMEDGKAQSRLIARLARTEAGSEPLYRWAETYRAAAMGTLDRHELLARAEDAQRLFILRMAGDPPYTWSLPLSWLEACIDDLLCECHLAVDDPHAGLAAARHAQLASPDSHRAGRIAWILCEYFPEHQDEAFDAAHRNGAEGGYEAVRQMPGYADYVRRAEKAQRARKAWRWSARNRPASESELRAAEAGLGGALPPGYRRFLADKGPAELLIAFDDQTKALRFLEASDLAAKRDELFDYLMRRDSNAQAFIRKEYGVGLRDLVPVAEPKGVSGCMLVHIGAGDRFGWCYLWHHDDPWELTAAQPDFDAAIAALTSGIERRDRDTMFFLEITID
jgi:SMI1/KNR4 family protein SUKH-1